MSRTRLSKLTLTTIPPEILLTIISHLPSSSSIYALSLASRTLASFIHGHASIICNTRIQQNPVYVQASSILQSSYVNGWLVPGHPCVLEVEEQWQHELESRAASRASSPACRGALRSTGCCFRANSYGSQSSNDRASRPLTRPMSRLALGYGAIEPASPSHDPLLGFPAPRTRHTDPSLSPTLGTPLPFKLSRPGPQYLAFLERYASELVTRWEMDIGSVRAPSPTSTLTEHGTQLHPIDEADEQEAEKREQQFEFMLKLYCLRSWLVVCHNTFVSGEGRGGVGYAEAQRYVAEPEPSRREKFLVGAREEFSRLRKLGRETVDKVLTAVKPKQKKKPQPPKRLLFGELDADSASSLGIEVRRSANGSVVASECMRDAWVKGLLWYYGVATQFDPLLPTTAGVDVREDQQPQPQRINTQKDSGKWYRELKNEHVRLQAEMSRPRYFKKIEMGWKSRVVGFHWRSGRSLELR